MGEGCWAAITKCHRLGGLNTEIYGLRVLEARSPKSPCWQGWCLLRVVKENLVYSVLLAAGGVLAIFRTLVL